MPGQVADNAQLHLAPEVVNRRTVVKARKGDNVTRIAARYHLKPTDVAEWNDVSAKSAFKTGEQVVVFLPVRGGGSAPSARSTSTARASAAPAPTRKTAVAKGRTKATTTAARKTISPVQARMHRPGAKLAGGR